MVLLNSKYQVSHLRMAAISPWWSPRRVEGRQSRSALWATRRCIRWTRPKGRNYPFSFLLTRDSPESVGLSRLVVPNPDNVRVGDPLGNGLSVCNQRIRPHGA